MFGASAAEHLSACPVCGVAWMAADSAPAADGAAPAPAPAAPAVPPPPPAPTPPPWPDPSGPEPGAGPSPRYVPTPDVVVPARRSSRPGAGVAALVAVAVLAALIGGALLLRGGDDTPAVATRGEAPTTAPPPLPTFDEAAADVKSKMTAQLVEMTDTGVFTEDVERLAAYQEPGELVWGRGLAPPRPGVVNAAVGEDGRLLCLTVSTDEGVAVATLRVFESDSEVRTGGGPIGSCTAAGVQGLTVASGDG